MRRLSAVLAVAALIQTFSSLAHAGGLVAIEGVTSTVMQEKQSSFSGLELRARVHPDQLIKQVEIMPTIEYWRNSSTVQPYGIEATRKDATMGIDARYAFEIKGWTPYAGAGWGLHFLSTRVNAPSLGLFNASNSVIKGGLSVLGGVSFGLSNRIDNFLELKYHHVPEYRQLKINWGLTYKL